MDSAHTALLRWRSAVCHTARCQFTCPLCVHLGTRFLRRFRTPVGLLSLGTGISTYGLHVGAWVNQISALFSFGVRRNVCRGCCPPRLGRAAGQTSNACVGIVGKSEMFAVTVTCREAWGIRRIRALLTRFRTRACDVELGETNPYLPTSRSQ